MSARRTIVRGLMSCVFTLIAVALLSGCWDRREIDTLAIISGIAVDRADAGQVALTAQLEMAKARNMSQGAGGGGGAQTQPTLAQASGPDTFAALRELSCELGRRPFLSHQRALIIGRSLAEQSIGPTLDYFLRDPEPRETMWVVVSAGSAAAVLGAKAYFSSTEAMDLADLVSEQERASEAAAVDLADLVDMLLGDAKTGFAPIAEVIPAPENRQIVRLSGTAIFLGGRMVGALTKEETQGLLWILGRVKGASLTVPGAGGNPLAALAVTGERTEVRPWFDGSKPAIDITVTADANLRSLMRPDQIMTPSVLADLETAGAAVISDRIKAAIAAAQQVHADIFGFAGAFHRSFRREWRGLAAHWAEQFPGLAVNVRTTVRVHNTGLVIDYSGPVD